MTEVTQNKFGELAQELGRVIRQEADQRLAAQQSGANADAVLWVSAFVDVRWFADAEARSAKLRVKLPNGDFYGRIALTLDMQSIIDAVWSVRKGDSSAVWYGLKVIVTHDGDVSTELNDDPNCVVDPTWFLS